MLCFRKLINNKVIQFSHGKNLLHIYLNCEMKILLSNHKLSIYYRHIITLLQFHSIS